MVVVRMALIKEWKYTAIQNMPVSSSLNLFGCIALCGWSYFDKACPNRDGGIIANYLLLKPSCVDKYKIAF
jgi:hypothetical protein